MNKKMVGLVLVLTMLCVTALAFADVPSKTTDDFDTVVSLVDENEKTPSALVIKLLKKDDTASAEIEKIYDFVTSKGTSPASYFSASVRDQIESLLPEGVDIDSMEMNEFLPIIVENYTKDMGNVAATFGFSTVYTPGQTVVALVGIVENGQVVYKALKAQVTPDGFVTVYFDATTLEQIQSGNAMLAILSK